MIKFNKFNVTSGMLKARVHYSLDSHIKFAKCVTVYHRDYVGDFKKIFGEDVIDDSEIMSDYFEKGRVHLTPGHPLYASARARAERNVIEMAAKWEQRSNSN